MSRHLLFALCLAGALWSAPATASRMEFELMRDGERIAGAEVCFQPAAALDETYRRWFWSDELRCLPADEILDFPAGIWNFFARHEDGWISSMPQLIVLDEAKTESGYRQMILLAEKAATLDVSGVRLAEDERLFLFFANRTSAFGSAIHPVPAGTTRQLIPAGVDVIPIVVRNQRPVRLLAPVNAKGGEAVAARERKRAEDTVDVVAWVQLDLTRTDEPEKLSPFDVRLRRGRQTIAQQFPMKNGAASHLSLVTFVDVPKGKAKIELRGGDWLPYQREIALSGDLVVLEEPLTSGPAAKVRAAWALPRGSVTGDEPPCAAGADSTASEVLVRLQRCPEADRCELVAIERAELAEAGDVQFAGLAPGSYRVDAIVGGMQVEPASVECRSGAESTVDVTPRAVTVRGHATRDGAPVSARLRFERGSARTDTVTGEYTLLLDRPLDAETVVRVEPCDGSKGVLEIVPVALEDGTVFDFDLGGRGLRVEVRDASSGRPIGGASVTYAAPGRDGEVRYASRAGETDGEGVLTIDAPPDRELKICARAAGYAEACVERSTRIALQRNGSRRGRVVTDMALAGAALYLAGAEGELLEFVPVGPDGVFHCVCDPERVAYSVLVSDAPMLVLPPPRESGEELIVSAAQPATVRTFAVALPESAASRGGRLSIAADGKLVPLLALTNHQIRRQLPILVLRGQDVPVADIAAGAIEVLLVPLYEDLPPELMGRDVAALREWQLVLPRKAVPPSGVVTFQ